MGLFGGNGGDAAFPPMPSPLDVIGDDNPLSLQADETAARQLDTGFATEVRGLVQDPVTGLAGRDPEVALAGIAETIPLLAELKDRYLAQAKGPRQKAMLEPLIDRRLDRAGDDLGRIAEQATWVLDDRSVAERLADLQWDASLSWRDTAHLRLLGRTAVDELHYQGERRGWDAGRTDTAVRTGLSDLYAGAVEAALGQDPERAATLYDHARDVIQPERQAVVERRIERAREERRVTEIVGGLADTPADSTRRPDPDDYQARAAQLTPPDASPAVQAQVTRMARIEHARADRAWQAARGRAATGALDWLGANPAAPLMAMPVELRDGLSPEQTEALDRTAMNGGRVVTDRDLYEKLDDQAVNEPEKLAVIDLTQYRLSLGDSDYNRLTKLQKTLAEGRPDPAFERHCLGRLFLGEGLRAANVDPDREEARPARQQLDRLLGAFEAVEGRPPTIVDIRGLVGDVVGSVLPRAESDPNIIRVADEPTEANGNTEIVPLQDPVEAGQGTAPSTKPGSLESQAATVTTATHPGKRVVLPNGKNVPSSEDPRTEFLMSPAEDLRDVAAAGRETGRKFRGKVFTNPLEAEAYARELVRKDLAQGGRFDYQRLWSPDDDAPGYLQLRQFRDVSNFNVGLYMQQAGIPKWVTLKIAGQYAKENSSNYMQNEPYGLDPRVKRWIDRGYEAGESGAFNLPFLLKKNKAPSRTAD